MRRSSAPYKSSFPFKREKDTHKGDYGKIAIIGGSYGMAGAVVLAANSCMRSGAGLVYIFVPEEIYTIVGSRSICSVIHPCKSLRGHFSNMATEEITTFARDKCDVVCIGPGLGRWKDLGLFLNKIVEGINKPLIIDADGLNLLNLDSLKKRKMPTILTPHTGEFARLTSLSGKEITQNRVNIAVEFAKKHGVILVLKGHETIVTDGENIYVNNTGNPGMATGGSGDSLAGIIPAFCAVMESAYEATCLAVYIHGLAGDIAAGELTETCLTAEDIVNYIPAAMTKIYNHRS